ncbi:MULTISPECIES: hypothetical protein [Moorena]|uniref:Uncharacterized protein n=2 Tax=Moorena producens TaxID=1155739 RepID=A0A1D9FV30_MOOP1|nr:MULTISPECIES: hypothetical protein [Moorena]NEO95756.1 hypothetical protein [Moorena sp. SIO3G5]NES83754.1 hypothetical protein [Moorena sp. SIO2B7]AOY79191.1 hypothetical protein BJP36_03935 [Moorena producens JHB]EGJ29221.1 hypothetical protein LYNGBM3L_64650 [Moorena producens 3L]NEO36407.1 hypothetical protein [Moorena sp. SIOASIH]
MAIFRQYIAPLLALLGFLIALLAVSSRIFLPNDMLAPAPIEEFDAASIQAPVSAQLVVNQNSGNTGE